MLLFTIGILVLSLAPSVATAVTLRSLEDKPNFSGMAEPYFPWVIMVFCLLFAFTSGGQMAFSFTPAEVDFLFTAPFDRRELLIYKLSKTILGLVFTALLLTISFLPVLTSWLSAFVGLMLTLALVQEVTLMTGMVAQIVAEHAYNRMRN